MCGCCCMRETLQCSEVKISGVLLMSGGESVVSAKCIETWVRCVIKIESNA